jgi:hypothetical protein
LFVFALFTLTPLVYVYVTNRGIAKRDELAGLLGTWTDEAGEEGNFITFSVVRRPAPGPIPGLELWEGKVACHNFLDGNDREGSWGYESWKPLRLNITLADGNRVAAIKHVDGDHLLVRFVEDLPPEKRRDVFRSPEVRRLRRVPTGAEPPPAGGKPAP